MSDILSQIEIYEICNDLAQYARDRQKVDIAEKAQKILLTIEHLRVRVRELEAENSRIREITQLALNVAETER